MTFEAVVGNPPYQKNDGGGGQGASSSTLYDKFVVLADKLADKYTSLIIKSNWTIGGKALNEFREYMINDTSISRFVDYTSANVCFDSVQFPGGVCYFLRDKGYSGKCKITTVTEHGSSDSFRFLREYGCDTYIRYNEAISILDKVKNAAQTDTFDTIVSSRNIFGLSTNYTGKNSGAFKCYTGSSHCFVDKDDFEYDDNADIVSSYKVMVSYANGAAMSKIPYSVISRPFVARKDEICTDTYLVIGKNETSFTANAIVKYMKTKFFRFLLSLKKSTPVAAKKTYNFIPLQDFTEGSDIDWNKSVAEIDEKLYEKYTLANNEIAFIESMIRSMDQI